ncbi:hypothetical protein [Minwuia sp. IMCC3077]|uniref:hypothetical protein n=1 Tax=Minwuia sp. IMCC3077 TaxID=3040676 RepID=UPI0024788641|nr:hypothetical protein [Minwuia sp. IMCC3077]
MLVPMKGVVTLLIAAVVLVGCTSPQQDWRKYSASDPVEVFTVTGNLPEIMRCVTGSLANRITVSELPSGVIEIGTSDPVSITRVYPQPGGVIRVEHHGPMSLLNGPMANRATAAIRECAATS